MALRSSVVLTPLADKQSKLLFYFTFFIFIFCSNSKFLPVERKTKKTTLHPVATLGIIYTDFSTDSRKKDIKEADSRHQIFMLASAFERLRASFCHVNR